MMSETLFNYMVSIFRFTPNRILLKHKCPNDCYVQIRHVYLSKTIMMSKTLFSYMVVFHAIYSIWHGPPLSYLHGKKLG